MDPTIPQEQLAEPPGFARGSEAVQCAWALALESYRSNANGNAAADVEHPAITARLLHEAGYDEQTVATAVLHDVIEDTGLDRAVIAQRCGEELARRVEALTENPEIGSYAARKAELRARGIAAG
ncbi:MAG: HD domain-containing protein, partial [Dehalococcoidia bacterium]